jgi:DNA anti-recombination protein RmuC
MTDEELRVLVTNLATATASNTEAIRELGITVDNQGRINAEFAVNQVQGLASLRASVEIQLTAIENQRESIGSNAQLMADSMEMAATALRMSAETTRNIDRLEQNIDRLEQMLGIVIRDNQADRARISGLEGQN